MPIMLAWHTQEHRLFTMHYMRLCREDFAAFENRQTHRINANSPNARLRRNNKVHIFAVNAAAPPILFAASPPFGSMRHSCFSLPSIICHLSRTAHFLYGGLSILQRPVIPDDSCQRAVPLALRPVRRGWQWSRTGSPRRRCCNSTAGCCICACYCHYPAFPPAAYPRLCPGQYSRAQPVCTLRFRANP